MIAGNQDGVATSHPTVNTLYIIYNASGTVAGKLIYGYRKLTAPTKPKPDSDASSSTALGEAGSSSEPVCAACDITHGGLSLRETAAWTNAKQEIESQGRNLRVVQLHRNEVSEDLKKFVKEQGIRYPTVILQEGSAEKMKLVLDQSELASCDGDPERFLQKLAIKDVIQRNQASL